MMINFTDESMRVEEDEPIIHRTSLAGSERPVLVSELNKKVDLRDSDVKFNQFQFMKAFTYHVIFFGVLGPFTQLFMAIFEHNFILSTNMSFHLP